MITMLPRPDVTEPVAVPPPVEADMPAAATPVSTGARGVARGAVAALAIIALALGIQIVLVSGLQHSAAQGKAFAKLRSTLAEGTAPVVGISNGKLLALGTPIALIEIPRIGVREVIGEGTTPGVLTTGPGHRRDTPFPGQAGVSEIYGRRAAYGGPFKRIGQLRRGDRIKVTTGQGVASFRVIGARDAGDPISPIESGAARLTLATASGRAFVPSGVRWIDAELTSDVHPGGRRAVAAGAVPIAERPMGNDASTVWALVLWLQALIVIAVGAVWCWMRWGRHQTWIVCGPVAALVGLAAAGQVTRLLPNLL